MWRVASVELALVLGCSPVDGPSADEADRPLATRGPSLPVELPVEPAIDPPAREFGPIQAVSPEPLAVPDGRAPLRSSADPAKPEDPRIERARQVAELESAPRHRPEGLAQPPRATRIKPGIYRCKVSREYRLRDCTVERTPEGHVMLTVPHALLALRGVLWDEGNQTRFDGWTTAPRPFGCFGCQEQCYIEPEQCHCDEFPIEGSRECLAQPVRFALRGGPNKWTGTLAYRMYHNEYKGEGPERRVVSYGSRIDQFEVTLVGPPRDGPARP